MKFSHGNRGMLHIDGSFGEGGGQILRTALALSVVLRRPVGIDRIRANRPRPGLRPQHLQAVQALAAISGAEVEGAEVGSSRLSFRPHQLQAGSYRFEIGTAGAGTLLIAAILPPLLFAGAPSEVVVTGGTHVPFSPPYPYLAEIFLPVLAGMGGSVESELGRWGWYPGGGGDIRLRIIPCRRLHAVRLEERGRLRSLEVAVALSHLPDHIGRREEEAVRQCLAREGCRAASRIIHAPSPGQGNAVFLKASFASTAAGFTGLGRRGKPAERVAEEVCRAWLSFMRAGAPVDRHLADQLIPFLALAAGRSTFKTEELTSHLRTNIWLVERFLPVRFEVDERTRVVAVKGSGYTPPV